MKPEVKETISRWIYLLKYPFKLWAYEVLDQLVMAFVPYKASGKLLIFRLDLIGDYLMCRPFFESLRKENRWKEYSFSFAGNLQVKALAETLDGQIFESFFWIDRPRFINSLVYRFKILSQIRKAGFEIVLYPSHTRQYWLESVVRVSGAGQKWTGKPVGQYMSRLEKDLTDKHYTSHLDTGGPVLFEFYRNRNFFSFFSEEANQKVHLWKEAQVENAFPNRSGKPVVVLAPGASTPKRQWPVAFFAKVMEAISKNGEVSFWVLGGPSEKAAGEKIIDLLPDLEIENKAGTLSLPASMELLATANLLISNESSPVHMAATTGTPCVCISQGNHFGRWNPYPKEIAPGILTVYPPSFGNVCEAYDALAMKFHNGSTEDVSEIGWERVYDSSMHLLRDQGYFPTQARN